MTRKHYLKILKGAGIAGAGAILTYLLGALPDVHLGAYTPAVTALLSVLINAALKYLQSVGNPEGV